MGRTLKTRVLYCSAVLAAVALTIFGVHVDATAKTKTCLPTSERVVALTFDDGPDPRFTQDVLDILNAEDVPGTFFLIGSKVQEDAGATDYTGHIVGYHTHSHGRMIHMTPAEQVADFERGAAVFPECYDTGAGYWRGPRKEAWPTTVRWAAERGHYLLWSCCYDAVIRDRCPEKGKRGPVLPHEERVAAFMKQVKPGDVVLMHDGNSNGKYLVEDLPVIIRELKAQGYRFTTPDEFFLVAEDAETV